MFNVEWEREGARWPTMMDSWDARKNPVISARQGADILTVLLLFFYGPFSWSIYSFAFLSASPVAFCLICVYVWSVAQIFFITYLPSDCRVDDDESVFGTDIANRNSMVYARWVGATAFGDRWNWSGHTSRESRGHCVDAEFIITLNRYTILWRLDNNEKRSYTASLIPP